VAELKGSQFAEEIITIGGHFDSWDVNLGALDDGAGIELNGAATGATATGGAAGA
jgi:Zn-dependent M28 family amino/carboxypeptidase